MICPICNQKFSYLKIRAPLLPKKAESKGIFHCPNCDGRLKLTFKPMFTFGVRQVGDLLFVIFYLAVYITQRKFGNSFTSTIIMFLGFVFFIYILATYWDKFGVPIKVKDNPDSQEVRSDI